MRFLFSSGTSGFLCASAPGARAPNSTSIRPLLCSSNGRRPLWQRSSLRFDSKESMWLCSLASDSGQLGVPVSHGITFSNAGNVGACFSFAVFVCMLVSVRLSSSRAPHIRQAKSIPGISNSDKLVSKPILRHRFCKVLRIPLLPSAYSTAFAKARPARQVTSRQVQGTTTANQSYGPAHPPSQNHSRHMQLQQAR